MSHPQGALSSRAKAFAYKRVARRSWAMNALRPSRSKGGMAPGDTLNSRRRVLKDYSSDVLELIRSTSFSSSLEEMSMYSDAGADEENKQVIKKLYYQVMLWFMLPISGLALMLIVYWWFLERHRPRRP